METVRKLGMDTDVLLNDLNEIQWDVNIFQDDGQIGTIQGINANLPLASAYIFSVIPPGPLPKQFWQDKQYSSTNQEQFCSIFKVSNLTVLGLTRDKHVILGFVPFSLIIKWSS